MKKHKTWNVVKQERLEECFTIVPYTKTCPFQMKNYATMQVLCAFVKASTYLHNTLR